MKKMLFVIVSVFVVASITGCGKTLEPELTPVIESWIVRADASEKVARAHAGDESFPIEILESWMENPVAVEEKYITELNDIRSDALQILEEEGGNESMVIDFYEFINNYDEDELEDYLDTEVMAYFKIEAIAELYSDVEKTDYNLSVALVQFAIIDYMCFFIKFTKSDSLQIAERFIETSNEDFGENHVQMDIIKYRAEQRGMNP